MKTATKKTLRIENIKDRDCVLHGRPHVGRTLTGQHVELVVGESVRLFGEREQIRTEGSPGTYRSVPYMKAYDRTFVVGDTAEYDSYNMHFTGTIVSVGEKTIGIQPEGSNRVRRLGLYEFTCRNWDFNLEKIAARNLDVSMSC